MLDNPSASLKAGITIVKEVDLFSTISHQIEYYMILNAITNDSKDAFNQDIPSFHILLLYKLFIFIDQVAIHYKNERILCLHYLYLTVVIPSLTSRLLKSQRKIGVSILTHFLHLLGIIQVNINRIYPITILISLLSWWLFSFRMDLWPQIIEQVFNSALSA